MKKDPIDEAAEQRARLVAQHADWERRQEAERRAHVIIVTGGRNYGDRVRLFAALDKAHTKKRITLLVHGGAPGADRLADDWARERGVPVEQFPADWASRGPAAGPERNQRMVDRGAAGVIAFPGGHGTADCARRAEAAGIRVWRPFG